MNERIIYSNPDGSVAVIIPAPQCGLTIHEIALKDVPPGVPYEIVDVSAVPSDRTFRNAWVKGNGRVEHDLIKARDVAHVMRRAKRETEFAPLDEVIAKQIPGKKAADAEIERQKIRDKYTIIQDHIDLAASVAELKSIVDGM